MGIYNPKANMPENCWACPFCTEECFGAYKCYDAKDWGSREERAKDCPLVEVETPHGDLVDRDALMYKARWWDNDYTADGFDQIVEVIEIKNVPAVIKAET